MWDVRLSRFYVFLRYDRDGSASSPQNHNSGHIINKELRRRHTGIERRFERLDVGGHAGDAVDPNLVNPSLLHLFDTLTHDVRHLGALASDQTHTHTDTLTSSLHQQIVLLTFRKIYLNIKKCMKSIFMLNQLYIITHFPQPAFGISFLFLSH